MNSNTPNKNDLAQKNEEFKFFTHSSPPPERPLTECDIFSQLDLSLNDLPAMMGTLFISNNPHVIGQRLFDGLSDKIKQYISSILNPQEKNNLLFLLGKGFIPSNKLGYFGSEPGSHWLKIYCSNQAVIAFNEQLITYDFVKYFPSPDFLATLLTDTGLTALREGLINKNQIYKMNHDNLLQALAVIDKTLHLRSHP